MTTLERFYKAVFECLLSAIVAVVLAIFLGGINFLALEVIGLTIPLATWIVIDFLFEVILLFLWLVFLLPRVTRRLEGWWMK